MGGNAHSRMPKINAEWANIRHEVCSLGISIYMVLLVMMFMHEQRLKNQSDIPLLSCPDVATLLKFVLPGKDINEDKVFKEARIRTL
jgi:hypothetical protein